MREAFKDMRETFIDRGLIHSLVAAKGEHILYKLTGTDDSIIKGYTMLHNGRFFKSYYTEAAGRAALRITTTKEQPNQLNNNI